MGIQEKPYKIDDSFQRSHSSLICEFTEDTCVEYYIPGKNESVLNKMIIKSKTTYPGRISEDDQYFIINVASGYECKVSLQAIKIYSRYIEEKTTVCTTIIDTPIQESK